MFYPHSAAHRNRLFVIRIVTLLILACVLSSCQNFHAGPAGSGKGPAENAHAQNSHAQKETLPGRRSRTVLAKDKNIERTIELFIRENQQLSSGSIETISYNRIVLIIGQIATEQQKQKISAFLRKMVNDKAIKTFHNQLEIAPGRTILNIASDWLLSTELKSRLTVAETMDNSRIYATVNNNTAYFMGTVTRPEAEKITELTQTLSNIKKIVLTFEYLN